VAKQFHAPPPNHGFAAFFRLLSSFSSIKDNIMLGDTHPGILKSIVVKKATGMITIINRHGGHETILRSLGLVVDNNPDVNMFQALWSIS
jgi:hypothetical protein